MSGLETATSEETNTVVSTANINKAITKQDTKENNTNIKNECNTSFLSFVTKPSTGIN